MPSDNDQATGRGNWPAFRRTLASSVSVSGIGVHSGAPATAVFHPAPAGHGVRFRRSDVPDGAGDVPALWSSIHATTLGTTLANAQGTEVMTVEHLMAAISAACLHDLEVVLDGPEIPIMDGSAAEFLRAFDEAGFAATDKPVEVLRMTGKIEVVDGEKRAVLLPAEEPALSVDISFADRAIGRQVLTTPWTPQIARQICQARTFGFAKDAAALRAAGLAKGASLENTIVIEDGAVLNEGGLRNPDEFVRHKALDLMGDLALAGAPLWCRVEAQRPGHTLTSALLEALFSQRRAFTLTPL